MSRYFPWIGRSQSARRSRKSSSTNSNFGRLARKQRYVEGLEPRNLLAWDSIFTMGILIVQTPEAGDVGVLRIGANNVIYLDGDNSGNFVDTGAVYTTLLGPIQINEGDTPNAKFIIDNGGPGGFFAGVRFEYNGGADPFGQVGTGLTIRGRNGGNDSFFTTYVQTNYDFNNKQQFDPPFLAQIGRVRIENTSDTDDFRLRYINLRGDLTLDGRGGNDVLTVRGTLGGDALDIDDKQVRGAGADINYSNFENLVVQTDGAADVLRITKINTPTLLEGGGGNDAYQIDAPLNAELTIDDAGGTGDRMLVFGSAANDNFYLDIGTIKGAGSDILYTKNTIELLDIIGNQGDDNLTIQVPPVFPIPFGSDFLPVTRFTGDDANSNGNDLLTVLGNDQGVTDGNDVILVVDFLDTGPIKVAKVEGIVIKGLSGNDNLENDAPVSSILIGGAGADILVGTDFLRDSSGRLIRDILLGGDGFDDLSANAGDDFLFPDQDEFGFVFDVGQEPVDAGDDTDAGAVGTKPAQFPGDLDDVDLPSSFDDNPNERLVPVIDPARPTDYLYRVTPALLLLEEAFQLPVPQRAFGAGFNQRGEFARYDAFIGRAYSDYLNRSVDSRGLKFWSDKGKQGLTIEGMQANILASREYQQGSNVLDTNWIRSVFSDNLGRLPDDDEFNHYLHELENGAPRVDVALEFLKSSTVRFHTVDVLYSELFRAVTPTDTDRTAILADMSAGFPLAKIAIELFKSGGNYFNYVVANNVGEVGFVGALYRDVLQRGNNFSIDEVVFWTGMARNEHLDRSLVVNSLLTSVEYRTLLVQSYYQTHLGRPADQGGLNFWINKLRAGVSDEQVLAGIISSDEYFQKQGSTSDGFVRALYREVLRRASPPSQEERDYWIAVLGNAPRGAAAARADVVVGFCVSDEFRGLLIDDYYEAYEGRTANTTERNNGLNMFKTGSSQEGVQASILLAR